MFCCFKFVENLAGMMSFRTPPQQSSATTLWLNATCDLPTTIEATINKFYGVVQLNMEHFIITTSLGTRLICTTLWKQNCNSVREFCFVGKQLCNILLTKKVSTRADTGRAKHKKVWQASMYTKLKAKKLGEQIKVLFPTIR